MPVQDLAEASLGDAQRLADRSVGEAAAGGFAANVVVGERFLHCAKTYRSAWKVFKNYLQKTFHGRKVLAVKGEHGLPERLRHLAAIAGSQRKFAELVGVSGPAVVGWVNGAVPYRSTFERIAERTGVSLEWLMTGEGDEREEIASFRRRLTIDLHGDNSLRLKEELPNMECPLVQTGPEMAGDRQIAKAADHMDARAIAGWIADVLADAKDPDRFRVAGRLLPKLAERLAAEQKRTQARS